MGRGLLFGLVAGIAAVVITVIIAFVVVSTVAQIDDDISIDGTATATDGDAWINTTDYTLTLATKDGFASPVVTAIVNSSNGASVGVGNASVTNAGVVTNATPTVWSAVNITYTYTYSVTEDTSDKMIGNFTDGVDNVSTQVPTVLLVGAVVLVLGILFLLWQQYKRMGMSQSTQI